MVFNVGATAAEHDLGFRNVRQYLMRVVVAVVGEGFKTFLMQEAVTSIRAVVGLGLVVVEGAVQGLAIKEARPRHAGAEIAVAAIVPAACKSVHVVQGKE